MNKSRMKGILAALLAVTVIFSAVPFANAAAQSVEYSGSSSYTSSQYYKNLKKVKLTGDQAADIVAVALSQVGYHEGSYSSDLAGNGKGTGNFTEYGRWFDRQDQWCNEFLCWCANIAGISTSIVPKLASSSGSYSTYQSMGVKTFAYSSACKLQTGDMIFVCTHGGHGCIDHIGIVTDADSKNIYTVEGNLSDEVKTAVYPVSDGYSSYNNARITYVARPNYKDSSAKLSNVKAPSFVTVTDDSVLAVFDNALTLEDAKTYCASQGGKLADFTKKEAKAFFEGLSGVALSRYRITVKGKDRILTENGKVIADDGVRRGTGFVLELSLKDIKPSNTASFGGSKYEIYDVSLSYGVAKAFAKAMGGCLVKVDESAEKMLLPILMKESDAYFTSKESTLLLNDGSKSSVALKDLDKEAVKGFIVEYHEGEKITVDFDANGGKNTPNEQVGFVGEAFALTDVTPVKGRKEFLGWSLSKDNDKIAYRAGESVTFNEDITLYAVWG